MAGSPLGPPRAVLAASGYAEFRKRLRDSGCTRCALAAGRTRIVVDRGNPDAKILAIGEAPGAQEDARGVAFCGRAGKMLDDLFAAEGLSTDEHLLIVNVVKCRPPGNRAPHREEAARCRPFLERQLALSPARAIALMGATALRHFAPERAKGPLADQVGRFFGLPDWPDREFVTLYHPAAILYNRS
ncbi:MAG: uracil-DNA glycosylase, partial [Acidobacteria bacterium]|nr:uracil-DNA glycosylase [Acidobacteriota bacterium]